MANKAIIKQKEEEVNKLAEKMKDAKLVLFADYRGINVEDVTKLRKTLRESNTEYSIVKNNISRRALEKCEIQGLETDSVNVVYIRKDGNYGVLETTY